MQQTVRKKKKEKKRKRRKSYIFHARSFIPVKEEETTVLVPTLAATWR